MRTSPAGLVVLLALIIGAPPARAGDTSPRPAAVTVKSDPLSPTGGIQEAIDTLGADGGVVTIPPGEYVLRQCIRVRSHITLQGSGPKTVLHKGKQVGTKLAAKAGAESRSLKVQSAKGFRAGDEIGVYDANTVGWLHAHAVVKDVRDDELLLDRRVGRDFDPAEAAAAINYFPAITGRELTQIVLKDLTIDGRGEENPGLAAVSVRGKRKPADLGFTFAAINLMEMKEGRVEGCRVKGWPADGISLQKGSRNVVRQCVVEGCRGPGFHAGGRETDSEFTDNEAHGNLGEGFYFCAWVTRVTVKNNKFVGNKGDGIGGLGDSGDIDNIVEGNLCRENGGSGISLWDGERNTVKNNTCANNSQASPGRWSGITLSKTENSIVSGNRCFDDQKTRTQKHGVEELENCRGNTITDNDCRGNGLAGVALAGKDAERSGNRE
jgi:parallel beta-helix repeat protein